MTFVTTFNAYAALERGQPLEPFEYTPKALGPTDVEIEVINSGLCHSDISMVDNEWGMSTYPLVPGHEVVGTVVGLGSGVQTLQEGDRVGVGWQSNSCGRCEWCRTGEENLCGDMEGTIVRGRGGFADRLRVDARFAVPIPTEYPSAYAGPMMCGGITVFTPMVEFGVRPGMKVGVVGIGGLGHLALQFARAMGCEVTAFSRSRDKEEEARSFGAHEYVATKEDEDPFAGRARSLDFILNTVSADVDWNPFLDMLRPKGTMAQVGFPDDPQISLNFVSMLFNQSRFAASPIGSPEMLRRMLEFALLHDIKPQIERYAMSELNEAMDRARAYRQRYRIVLER